MGRNDSDTSSNPIVLQHQKHLSSKLVRDGLDLYVGEEIKEIPLNWIMVIELRSDALDVVFKLSYIAGRYSTPPIIRHLAASENNGHAPGIIIRPLVLDFNTNES